MHFVDRGEPFGAGARAVALIVLFSTAIVMRTPLGAGAVDATADDPLQVAAAVDTNPSPVVFETDIVAKLVTRDIGDGRSADLWTYNGTTPGPQIRVRVGDRVVVHFRNELPLPSGIHWHGIELSNTSDGTELTQNAVPTGGTFLYAFTVPRPGIFWYHPHHDATNAAFRNQFGSIVVDDPHDATLVAKGVLPPPSRTKALFVSDTTVCKDPGQNDTDTYDDSLPWAGGGPLPEQPGPFPSDLCDRPIDEHGNAIRDAQGRPVPLPKGAIPNIQKTAPDGIQARTNEGQTVLANGHVPAGRSGSPEAPGTLDVGARTLRMTTGEGLRLQAVNASTIRFVRLRLTDSSGRQIPLVRVGGEGGLLDHARVEGGRTGGLLDTGTASFDTKYDQGEILLAPSDRADLVVAVPSDAAFGTATLWTLDYARTGTGYANLPTVPVLHLDIAGTAPQPYTISPGTPLRADPDVAAPVERLGPAYVPYATLPDPSGTIRPLLDPAAFTPPKPGSANEDVRFAINGQRPTIDGVVGTHGTTGDYTTEPHTATSRYARLGDILELTVTNTTPAHHTFHLHGFSFQPLAFERYLPTTTTGGDYVFDYREFVDSIDIPPSYSLRFRVRLDDRPLPDGVTPGGAMGRWVLHCHLFFHHGLGMHSEFVVTGADGNERPNLSTDATTVAAAQDGSASATGRFSDPDGDPMALSTSEGTVVDAGSGHWLWKAPSGSRAGTHRVFVSATDAGGHVNQVAFELTVPNRPPVVAVMAPTSGSDLAAGSSVTVTAQVTDDGGPLSCRFDWDDGTGPGLSVPVTGGRCSDTRTLSVPGVRTVVVASTDEAGATGSATTVVVVHDAAAGGVEGRGTIVSPLGALASDPTATGPATFDFGTTYVPGAGTPSGKTKFGLQLPQFDLRAEGYRWLVVTSEASQVLGGAKVNGERGYTFLLTAAFGEAARLRIKVWDRAGAVVYDNVRGAPDDLDVARPQLIASGTIRRT